MPARPPLQDVVRVICDALSDLASDDQSRALEAVRLTLGLDPPVAVVARAAEDPPPPQDTWATAIAPAAPVAGTPAQTLWEPSLFEDPPEAAARSLPTVVVQMMGDRPMVVGQQVGRPGRTLVVIGPQRAPQRRLPAAAAPDGEATLRRCGGFVRSLR